MGLDRWKGVPVWEEDINLESFPRSTTHAHVQQSSLQTRVTCHYILYYLFFLLISWGDKELRELTYRAR